MDIIDKIKTTCKFVMPVACGLLVLSCNKKFPEDEHRLRTDYLVDSTMVPGADSKKVLYIIVDGAQGNQVDTIAPANMIKLTKTSVYTWRGVSGYNPADTTLESAWATMLTGVNSSKHGVIGNFSTADFGNYPSVVTRLKELKPNINIVSFAASPLFSQKLTAAADKNQVFENNDQAVSEALLDELRTNATTQLVIAQFNSVAKAGKQYGYSNRSVQYADAVRKVDGYIGAAVDVLKSRPNYAKENWLIVIASNYNETINANAGKDSLSAYDDTRRNCFVIFNNPRLGSKLVPYPTTTKGVSVFADSTLIFQGLGSEGINASVENPGAILDLNKGQAMTVELKVKFLNESRPTGDAFTNFVGNINPNSASDGDGWAIKYDVYQNNNNFFFYANNRTLQFDRRTKDLMADNKWHSVTLIMDWTAAENDGFYVTTYVDGEVNVVGSKIQTSKSKVGSGLPMLIGAHGGGHASQGRTDMFITDVRVWNVALPPNIAAAYNCKTDIPINSPYYNNLIMNYKVSNGVIRDFSPYNRPNAVINDPSQRAKWKRFAEFSNGVCPNPDNNFYKLTPNGIDIPLHIYQWLDIVPRISWRLDGIYWPNNYEDVKLPDNF